MEDFVGVLFILIILAIPIGTLIHQYTQHQKVKAELYKLIQQAGAQNIHIEGNWMLGKRDAWRFVVTYTDVNGNLQKRQVTRHTNSPGQTSSPFLWDKPLIHEPDTRLSSRLNTKEQIISDLDAEIKRLQKEVARLQKKS